MSRIKQRRTIGAILKVPLGDALHTYAQTLNEADFAFFDARTDGELAVADVVASPILFREAVHKSAWTTGRWRAVSESPLTHALSLPVPRFVQDALHPERFQIYLGGTLSPATRLECTNLQRCAVWDPNHIEDRLRDYYAGNPNKWVELLRLR